MGTHDGLVYVGEKEVITYGWTDSTPEHEVYTDDEDKVPFQEAMGHFRRLAVGGVKGVPVRYSAFDRKLGEALSKPEVCRGDMFYVPENTLDSIGRHQGQKDYELHLSGQVNNDPERRHWEHATTLWFSAAIATPTYPHTTTRGVE